MCITPEEIKEIIHEEIFNPKEDGNSRLSIEMNKHLDLKIKSLFWSLMTWLGGTIVIAIVVSTAAWININNEVEDNTDFRESGDRFTKSEGKLLQQQIDQNQKDTESIEAWLIRIEAKLDEALK